MSLKIQVKSGCQPNFKPLFFVVLFSVIHRKNTNTLWMSCHGNIVFMNMFSCLNNVLWLLSAEKGQAQNLRLRLSLSSLFRIGRCTQSQCHRCLYKISVSRCCIHFRIWSKAWSYKSRAEGYSNWLYKNFGSPQILLVAPISIFFAQKHIFCDVSKPETHLNESTSRVFHAAAKRGRSEHICSFMQKSWKKGVAWRPNLMCRTERRMYQFGALIASGECTQHFVRYPNFTPGRIMLSGCIVRHAV